jgi:hypothetical protein
MKASELDKKFDAGEDVGEYFDFSKASRPNLEVRRVNVDMPEWMIRAADRESARLGITRQAVLKMWIAKCADETAA